jgi:hypothetical protein
MKLTWTMIFAAIGFVFGIYRNIFSADASFVTLIQEALGAGLAYSIFILFIGVVIDILILIFNRNK